MTQLHLPLNKWASSFKSGLSLYSRQKLEEIIYQMNGPHHNLEQAKQHAFEKLILNIENRIAILKEAQEIFSQEIEKMSLSQQSFGNKLELLTQMRLEIEESYLSLVSQLKNKSFSNDEIEATMELVKRLTQFSIAEIQDEKSSDLQTLRFNFINRLKIFLLTKDEGINGVIESLKKDEHFVSQIER